MILAYLSHDDCSGHEMGARHPERPARLDAIHEQLRDAQLDGELRLYEAPLVDSSALEAVHDADYLHSIEQRSPAAGLTWLDADTAMNPCSLRAARRAAGAVVRAVDLVMSGEAGRAFCAVRPPGHHAERARAMGFCIFNNVAVGAYHALLRHGLERVAIVDFDVHHGNGTEQIVAGDRRVLFCSSFQHPFYPYSGADSTADNVVNTPLPAGSDGRLFRDAVNEQWLPRLDDFQPQLLLVSAGFDAHRDDAMAGLAFVEDDYRWITAELCALADRHCAGRLVSTLEGGYDLPSLARSALAHIRACLSGEQR